MSAFSDLFFKRKIDKLEASLSRSTKNSQISLSRSAGSGYFETTTAAHVRFPFRVSTPLESFIVHISNFEERTSTAYSSITSVNGVWIGPAEIANGELTGKFSAAPTQVVTGSFALPTDGSAYSSATVSKQTFAVQPNVDYLISYGFTSDGTSIARSIGGCWRNGYAAQASQASPSNSLTAGYFAPFNSWVEVETTYQVPRIAMLGDSHTTGNAVSLPTFGSAIARYALAAGAIQINAGLGGSTLAEWNSTPTAQKWTKYASTGADAWINALGQNDIYVTTPPTLATMQANYYAFIAIAKPIFGNNMYVATIMPRNGTIPAGADALRIQYNDWLRTLPGRAVNVIDFAEAVDTARNSQIDARYVYTDNIHLGMAGNALLARTIIPGIGQRVTA